MLFYCLNLERAQERQGERRAASRCFSAYETALKLPSGELGPLAASLHPFPDRSLPRAQSHGPCRLWAPLPGSGSAAHLELPFWHHLCPSLEAAQLGERRSPGRVSTRRGLRRASPTGKEGLVQLWGLCTSTRCHLPKDLGCPGSSRVSSGRAALRPPGCGHSHCCQDPKPEDASPVHWHMKRQTPAAPSSVRTRGHLP